MERSFSPEMDGEEYQKLLESGEYSIRFNFLVGDDRMKMALEIGYKMVAVTLTRHKDGSHAIGVELDGPNPRPLNLDDAKAIGCIVIESQLG